MNKKVSDLFIDIYQNFNVVSQIEKMNQLSRKELLLLLILSIDSHNDEDVIVMKNYENFADELQIIHDSLPDSFDENFKATDIDILELAKETGDNFIKVQNLVDSKGNILPSPLSSEEATAKRREIGIQQIFENQ